VASVDPFHLFFFIIHTGFGYLNINSFLIFLLIFHLLLDFVLLFFDNLLLIFLFLFFPFLPDCFLFKFSFLLIFRLLLDFVLLFLDNLLLIFLFLFLIFFPGCFLFKFSPTSHVVIVPFSSSSSSSYPHIIFLFSFLLGARGRRKWKEGGLKKKN
jgi:hypothetical protein